MKTAALSLGPHLQAFFTEHLTRHKRVSPQTLASLRDSFRLLLEFLRARTGIEPAALQLTDVDASAILAFLDYLEQHRRNSVRSRNVRLSAIRTFFRYVALRDPDRLGQITQVMAIPVKRQEKKLIGALTREEMDALLAVPDRSTWTGRRDHALLLTMYNTGARVSEMTELRTQQVRFGATTYIELHGKGRKERTVPLWPHTGHVLRIVVPRKCRSRRVRLHFQTHAGIRWPVMESSICCGRRSGKQHAYVPVWLADGFHPTRFDTRQPCICFRRALISPSSRCGSVMRASRRRTAMSKPTWQQNSAYWTEWLL
jgi:site-specific recombinase XerD